MAKRVPPSQAGANKPPVLVKWPSATAGLQPIKWAERPVEERRKYLERTLTEYTGLVNELTDSSNSCLDKYEHFVKSHVVWRWAVILSTGTIALLNILVTHSSASPGSIWSARLSLGASAFAVCVTILATLEGFTNAAERAQGYRESREMFVDVSRDFAAAWETYVSPLQDSAEACANAWELHKRLIAADRELRARFKNLTMARQEHGGPG
jgi:hypothetical protein